MDAGGRATQGAVAENAVKPIGVDIVVFDGFRLSLYPSYALYFQLVEIKII